VDDLVATYFAGVTLFDGRAVRPRYGVLVSDGSIAWTGPHARAPREASAAEEIDGKGRTLTPGLIDCHVHLCFDGTRDFAAEASAMTEAMAAVKAVRNAARHLVRGVTTVRDLGAPGFVACEVGRAIEEGIVPGPRVLGAGWALTITGGHGHGMFAQEADGPDGVRAAVREQMRGGARAIKVVATGGVLTPGIAVDFTAFTPEELEAATDEAHKWGASIAAHAIGRTGITQAVRAGVDSIEHGSDVSPETARLMKEQGTFHVPTISALQGMLDHPDEIPGYALEKARLIVDRARESFRRVVRAGVRQACGTDAGTPFNPHGNTPMEIARMADWGLTALKALQSATSNAAALLRVDDRVGTVAPGMAADLVLYDGDPVDDLGVLLKPALVLKAGERVAGAGI
jgi:imidazolonepropionase-like amidohydrolase